MSNFLKLEILRGSSGVGWRERNRNYQSLLGRSPREKMGLKFGQEETIFSIGSWLSGTYKNESLRKQLWGLKRLFKHLEKSSYSLSQEKLYQDISF